MAFPSPYTLDAIASLDLFEKNNLLAQVQEKSQRLTQLLQPLKTHPHVGDIRQKGFMTGIEVVENKSTRKSFDPSRRIGNHICHRLRSRGIILRPLGDVIVMMPPLAMPIDDIARIVEALHQELLRL